jgi:hypothetical protein
LKKSMDLHPCKLTLFAEHGFSPWRDKKPHLKFYKKKVVLLICRMISRIMDFGRWMTNFGGNGISLCFGAYCSVQRSTQHRYTSIFYMLMLR